MINIQLFSVYSSSSFRVSLSFYFRRSSLLCNFYCHFGILLIFLELLFPLHILLQLFYIYYSYLFLNFNRRCCSWLCCVIVLVIFFSFSSNHIFSLSPHIIPLLFFLFHCCHHYSHFRYGQFASFQLLLLIMSCLWFQISLISYFYYVHQRFVFLESLSPNA